MSINPTNGGGGVLGYNTRNGWGSGSPPQKMYFPNHNAGASEAAAVNSIARMDRSGYYQGTSNYMDFLIAQYQDPTSMAMELGLTACNGCGGNAGKTRNLQLAYYLRNSRWVYGLPTIANPMGIFPNPFKGAEAVFGDIGVMFVGAERDLGGVFILAGNEAGYLYGYDELAGGAALDLSLSFEIGRYDVHGIDPVDFTSDFLKGEYFKGWVSVGQGISGGIGVAVSFPTVGNMSVTLVATSFQFGFGGSPFVIPVSGGFNKGIFNPW